MPDQPLLLGVDAGTTRIRAIVFDLAGRAVAEGSAPTPTTRPGPGQGEHDPEAVWRATLQAVRDAVAATPEPGRIRSAAVASMGEAGVLLDHGGRPVAPMLAWYDARPGAELAGIEALIDAAALHGVTGLCPDPTFTLPKLLWLRRHQPEAFARGVHWLGVSGWLAWRLCGRRAMDFSIASRTLALDLAARAWSGEVLGRLDLPASLLGELLPSGTPLGPVLPEVAAATGLPPDCVVAVGGHDHICGLLALGGDEPGVLLNSLGTAEALLLVVPAPSRAPELLAAGINQGLVWADRPLNLLYGGLPTSAAAVEWFRTVAVGADYAALIAEAEAVPAGAHEVMFLPHLRIGSPPFPDPLARGGFVGISDACGRGVLFRALLEGMALDAANQLSLMRRHAGGVPLRRVLATGGGTRNPLLLRLKAGLYGAPVEIADMPEGTCLGAALLGGLAAGLYPSLAAARAGVAGDWRRIEADPAWPEPARRQRLAAYAEVYGRLRAINRVLRPSSTLEPDASP